VVSYGIVKAGWKSIEWLIMFFDLYSILQCEVNVDFVLLAITETCGRLQTAVFHFNETRVVNLHEEPVTEKQILGRSLLHTFTVALAEAKQKYGVCELKILLFFIILTLLFF
jgi:hypothetical protein